MNQHQPASLLPDPQALIGTFRRFGAFGPVYEILGVGAKEPRGDCRMKVRVVESGEIVEYAFSNILDDPKER